MATLQEILSLGQSGLNASKAMTQMASFNIANANTPGYARQVLGLSAQGMLGLGVGVMDPQSIRSPFMARALVSTYGNLGFHQGQLDGLASVVQITNDLNGSGIGPAMAAFQDALSVLASNPSGSAERQALVNAGEGLAQAFASAREQMSLAAKVSEGEAKAGAANIAKMSQEIADLNERIQGSPSSPETNALINKRDEIVNAMSKLISVQVVAAEDNTVRLYTAGGRPLVTSEGASTIEISPTGGPPDHALQATIASPDGQVWDLSGDLGGELGGLLEAHNTTIGPGLHQLDEMAWHFVTAFNDTHSAGFGTDGSTGNAFFADVGADPAVDVAGAASRVAIADGILANLDLIAGSGQIDGPGDNTNLLALADLIDADGVMPDGSSVTDTWTRYVAQVAGQVQAAQTGLSLEQASADQFVAAISSESGVSIDEELIRLTTANQAFQAAGTIIEQAQSMTTTLLSLVS